MKEILLKVVQLENGELDYKKELQVIFSTPADKKVGAEVEEMRRSIRILDALEKAGDVLQLEDADHDYLRNRMKLARFAMVHPSIVQFVDDVTK